ncbi:MAG: sulfotransferase [Synechococcales bacterium]|nr:sulfotransferase [Synechococcales bacterium]
MAAPNKPLAALVCGYERGGTTLISEILRQHPDLYSGFECGFLLSDRPADFPTLKPYCDLLRPGWQLQEGDLAYICEAEDWIDAYQRLAEKSPMVEDKSAWIFDKTPKYMLSLNKVLNKVPDVPCILIVRDPRAVIHSWAKRSPNIQQWLAAHLKSHCERYAAYARGYIHALRQGHGDRLLRIQYEQLCQDGPSEVKKIFEFLNFDFDPAYLSFGDGATFNNVYGDTISTEYLQRYRQDFSDETCQQILAATPEAKEWFWEG